MEVSVSISVEHHKRRAEILENALDVFVEAGYADTTFQKIADRCGITRTILYLYFKNKREIFLYSIKRFTEKLETEIKICAATKEPSYAILQKLGDLVLSRCIEQAKLLSVIVDYLEYSRKSGGETAIKVKRRTIRMRHIISGLVISGQKKGELKKSSVGAVSDLFYGIVEAAIFRLAVLGQDKLEGLETAMQLFIDGLKA